MTSRGWQTSIQAALCRLREAGARIDGRRVADEDDTRALAAAAAEIYEAVRGAAAPLKPADEVAEAGLLAGSILMAARHNALHSVALADAIERLSELMA